MEDIAKVEKANGGTSYNEQQRRKQLSVHLQTLRAQCIVESRRTTYSITQKTSNTEQVPSSPSTNPDSHAGSQTPSSNRYNSNPYNAIRKVQLKNKRQRRHCICRTLVFAFMRVRILSFILTQN